MEPQMAQLWGNRIDSTPTIYTTSEQQEPNMRGYNYPVVEGLKVGR